MKTEELAVLVYGVLAIVAALTLAVITHSPLSAAFAFASAGSAYLFQFTQLAEPVENRMLAIFMVASIAFVILSVLASLVAGA
jgi:hypothetical protein